MAGNGSAKAPLPARLLLLGIALTALFSALMVCAYLIPDSLVRDNVIASSRVIFAEGPWPQLTQDDLTTQRDNWTEVYVLGMAVHQDGDPLRSAFLNPYYGSEDRPSSMPLESLESWIERGASAPANQSYGRYWQGYLVMIRPLLVLLTLKEIYLVMAVILVTLLVLSCIGLTRRVGWPYAAALVLSFAMVDGWMLPLSTKFWFSFAVALVGLCIAVRMEADELLGERACILFFVLGAVTVFLDYLSTPLVSLGLPLAAAAVCARDELEDLGAAGALRWFGHIVASWLAGYLMLGLANWLIYICVSPDGAEAVEAIRIRLDNWVGPARFYEGFNRFSGVVTSYGVFSHGLGGRVAVILHALALAACALPRGRYRPVRAVLAAASLIPIPWQIVLATSVAWHAWTVYRVFCLSVFCLACGLILTSDFGRGKPRHAETALI